MTHEQKEKLQIPTKLRQIGNSKGIIIPKAVLEHNNLEIGDKIVLQAEHSTEYGQYTSLWNETKQEENNQ